MNFFDMRLGIRLRLDTIDGFNTSLRLEAISITVSIDVVENVPVDNDGDLDCVFNLCTQFNTNIVKANIHVNYDDVESESSGDESETSGDEEDLSDDHDISDDMNLDEENISDYLEQYCLHDNKALRTSSWKDCIKEVGQVFENGRDQFRTDLGKFSIVHGFEFVFTKNDSERVTAVCKYKEDGCQWHVHARHDKVHDYFSIRKLCNTHTCNRMYKKLKDFRMSSRIIADEIKGHFKRNPIVSPGFIRDEFLESYGLEIPYMQAWRGVEIAKEVHYGKSTSTYDQLRYLSSETQKLNPDSKVFVEFDVPNSRFQRFFISYGPCIEGFNFCRPLLFLDVTHLKARYKGILLAATGKDANKGLYPLAIAIVDSETEDNWTWFLQNLADCLHGDRNITFISDRNKGLLEGVTKVFPNSPHGFCMLHLRANLKDRLGGTSREVKSKILELLWKAAQTPSKVECNNAISMMLVSSKDAVKKFLDNAPLENWANSFFIGKRYGELYSNVAESFNSWIRAERNLPAKNMIEDIRKKIMCRMAKRRRLAQKVTTIICPKYVDWLNAAIAKGSSWEIMESNDHVFEVLSIPSVVVDINDRTCTCGLWQIRCFPCSHAIATILKLGNNVMDYVEDYYKATFWYNAHARSILPIPSLGQPILAIEDVEIHPPMTKKPPGRPKKNVYASRSDKFSKKRPMKCSRCKTSGHHNRKTCTAVIE